MDDIKKTLKYFVNSPVSKLQTKLWVILNLEDDDPAEKKQDMETFACHLL